MNLQDSGYVESAVEAIQDLEDAIEHQTVAIQKLTVVVGLALCGDHVRALDLVMEIRQSLKDRGEIPDI